MANTDDTPTQLAILPDWQKGVTLLEQYSSNHQRCFSGREQRSANRVRSIYRMDYYRSGMTEAEARRRLISIRSEFEGPLTVPMWTDGAVLQSDMVGVSVAILDSDFIDSYEAPFDVYLWNPTQGGEFRSVTSYASRQLTLSGSGTLFTSGSFAFPCVLAIRELDSEAINSIDIETGEERVRLVTL